AHPSGRGANPCLDRRVPRQQRPADRRTGGPPQRDRHPHGTTASRDGYRAPVGSDQLPRSCRARHRRGPTLNEQERRMKQKPLLIAIAVEAVFIAGGYGMYVIGMQRGMGMSAPTAAASAGATAAAPAGPATAEGGED